MLRRIFADPRSVAGSPRSYLALSAAGGDAHRTAAETAALLSWNSSL